MSLGLVALPKLTTFDPIEMAAAENVVRGGEHQAREKADDRVEGIPLEALGQQGVISVMQYEEEDFWRSTRRSGVRAHRSGRGNCGMNRLGA
jgi:hypothetical protein